MITWLDPAPITLRSGLPSVTNPTGLRRGIHLVDSAFGGVLWISSWVVVLLAAASVVLRYRRSAGDERLQLKWFAYEVLAPAHVSLWLREPGPFG